MSYQLIKLPNFVLKDKVEAYLKDVLSAAGCEVQVVSRCAQGGTFQASSVLAWINGQPHRSCPPADRLDVVRVARRLEAVYWRPAMCQSMVCCFSWFNPTMLIYAALARLCPARESS